MILPELQLVFLLIVVRHFFIRFGIIYMVKLPYEFFIHVASSFARFFFELHDFIIQSCFLIHTE